MALNKNITLVILAVAMTVAMWMIPETISAESHTKRLLALSNYNTNPTRTATVATFCAGMTSRSELINNDDKTTAASYKAALSSQLKINGNTFINTAINGGDVTSEVKSSQTAFGVFIGFFLVGLVILILQWTCLCCCCCCPSCCPSKCCQKDENEQYTKCELYWPSIFLILLLLLIIIVCAIGLSKASTFKKGITDLQCSTSILFDDIVNGNATADGTTFFSGITMLVSSITNLNTNMGTMTAQMNDLNGNISGIVTHLATARDDIQKVPNNALANGNAPIVYNAKISQTFGSTTGGTFPSLFVSILGSSGNAGIIGGFYSTIDATYNTLSGISSSSSSFSSGASGFSSSIGSMTSQLNTVVTQINDMDNSVKSGLELMNTPKTMGTLVINLIYGIALGVSVLALLGVILMTFCDKYKCRYLMYFSCVILFFFGILGFLLAIIFSIIVPVVFFLCEWMDVTITSTGFNANTAKFLTDTQVQNIISTCLVGGTGDIMAVVGGASISTTINGLKNAVTNTVTFNTTSQIAAMDAALTTITTVVNGFRDGVIPDVSDSDSVIALNAVANSQSFGTCANTSPDSWVLSMANTTMVSCQVSGGATINPTTCPSQTDFTNNVASCRGCIDTSLVMNTWFSSGLTQGQWKTGLDSKYGTGCAAPFNTYFGNVWDNYYRIKVPQMVAIGSRWTTAVASVNTVKTDLTNVNTSLTNIITTLTGTFDTITDPKYGLIAGLNCRIIGEDLQTMVSSICVSNFITLYITRLLMGIAAFGILFAMCCIVCSGVRHFKHSERKDKVSPNFFGDKNSFENTDAAFRP